MKTKFGKDVDRGDKETLKKENVQSASSVWIWLQKFNILGVSSCRGTYYHSNACDHNVSRSEDRLSDKFSSAENY